MLDPKDFKRHETFRGLDDDALAEILKQARLVRYPAEATVFRQGDPADRFFLLLDGRLKATRIGADGERVMVRIVQPGGFFGIAKALGRTDYPATATAAIESRALAWSASAWESLLAAHPQMAMGAMETMGRQLQELHERLRELSTEDVGRRVAHALVRLADQAGRPAADGSVRIDMPLTRQDIAEMAGTTLYTVSRLLGRWQRQGLLALGRQKLTVLVPDGLKAIAEAGEGDEA